MAENVSGETLSQQQEAAAVGSNPSNGIKKKLLTIDPESKDFWANGRHYFVEGGVSFDRWNKYLKFEAEIGYSMSFAQIFNKITEAHGLLRNLKLNEITLANIEAPCNILRDILKGVADIEKNETPTNLKLCALFINEENEDRRYINNDMIARKVDDWEKEGIEMQGFFQLAHSIFKVFLQDCKSRFPDILK